MRCVVRCLEARLGGSHFGLIVAGVVGGVVVVPEVGVAIGVVAAAGGRVVVVVGVVIVVVVENESVVDARSRPAIVYVAGCGGQCEQQFFGL